MNKSLLDQKHVDTLKSILLEPKKIIITSHRNPDGDAIGSSLGLYLALRELGHEIMMTLPSEQPSVFEWMASGSEIKIYDNEAEEIEAFAKKCDLAFCLDFNNLDRIDKLGDVLKRNKIPMVMIDHHIAPKDFAEYIFSVDTASSTCELVYEFLVMMDWENYISKDVATSIYTGLVTDTGSFKFSTSPRVFRIVADLIERGVDDNKVQNLIFNSLPTKSIKLLGHCLANRMELLPEYRTGIIYLTKQDYEDFDIQRGDTEGIVNYLLKMKDIVFAAFIAEQPKIVKLSLRSKGDFSVENIAKSYFRGGGHKNASGGASFQPLSSTLKKFKEILPVYKEELLRVK